jgi:hypothetical protein
MAKHSRGWFWTLGALLLACGDSGGPGGAAGAGAPLTVGDACQTNCGTGLFCSHAGAFDGQCTSSCGNDQGCTLLAPDSRCYGNGQCGKPCSLEASECSAGQSCEPVANEYACVLP